ncbi:hypothetical protein [Nocardia shimofusensis]|uniref:hypothetical protein n=1 Tax=Nocardia shimofusensis TaxID=228596 RepID=UPI0008295B1F|nr:hypothetical protein [Nocardia shimofusensis]
MPSNLAVFAALAVFVPLFLGLYALLGSAAGAAATAFGAAVLAGLAGQSVGAIRRRTEQIRQVAATNRRVEGLAVQVWDADTRASLLSACGVVPHLLARTEAVDPAGLPVIAGKLLDYLASVESALRRYVEIQDNASTYRDAEALLARGRLTLAGFEHFAAHSADQIGEADLAPFFRDLAHLELMNPPRLPPSEDT